MTVDRGGDAGGLGDAGASPRSASGQCPAGQDLSRKGRLTYPTVVMLTAAAAVLLINYVETMVIPGVPTIQAELNTTSSVASWITSAFLVVGAAVAPLFGRLGDIYGKKRMFLIVLLFYTIGVGLAGFATTIEVLLITRAIQGVGFAVLPLGIAMVADCFPRERVATAQGVISGTVAIGAAAGLVIGAYIVEDLGWQWAFHTAVVLSIILLLVTAKVLRADVPAEKEKMDYAGTAILMAGVTLVLIYLTEGPSRGWTSWDNLIFLIPGLALTILFFFYERGKANPLIRLDLLRIRNVLVANLVGIVAGVAMFLLFFAVVYYAQLPSPYGLGLDIIATGLAMAPATIVMLIMGPILGLMVTRFGPRPILIFGSVVLIIGFLMFINYRATTLQLTVDIVISFVGIVAMIIPIVNLISISLPRDSTAVGLGINSMLRSLGGAVGPVLATTIMTSYTVALYAQFGGRTIQVGTVPSSTAFDYIFISGIVLTVVAGALSLTIKNYTFRQRASVEKREVTRMSPDPPSKGP